MAQAKRAVALERFKTDPDVVVGAWVPREHRLAPGLSSGLLNEWLLFFPQFLCSRPSWLAYAAAVWA